MTRLFFRYSQLLKLDELLKNDFSQININHLPPKHWFKSNRSEIVESRKLLIENFLQSVLSNSAVVEGKEFKVLDFLGLPRSFMEVYGGTENKMEKSLSKWREGEREGGRRKEEGGRGRTEDGRERRKDGGGRAEEGEEKGGGQQIIIKNFYSWFGFRSRFWAYK